MSASAMHVQGLVSDHSETSLAGDIRSEVTAGTPTSRLWAIRSLYRHGLDDDGVDPTRFGDWEIGGRCTDF